MPLIHHLYKIKLYGNKLQYAAKMRRHPNILEAR